MKALIITALMFGSLALAVPAEAKSIPNPPILCSITASDRLIEKGEKVIITWKSTNSYISYGPGNTRIANNGTMEVAPTKSTIYKFKFVGLGGNEKCGVRIRVAGDEPKN